MLALSKGERLIDYGLLAAVLMFSILSVYIVFIIFQEQVVEGFYIGAVKG